MDGGLYYLHEHHRYHRRRLTKFANPNMTYVSDDPLWWPAIDAFRLISYFVGSWRASWIMLVMSHSSWTDLAVASSTAVVYDWGERKMAYRDNH